MPPPPTFQECCFWAIVFGGFASVCVFMVVRRLPDTVDRMISTVFVTMTAILFGTGSTVAFPIRQAPESMPHWIGYSTQNALLNALGGSIVGCLVASIVFPFIARHLRPRSWRVVAGLASSSALSVMMTSYVFIANTLVGGVFLLMVTCLLIGAAISLLFKPTDTLDDHKNCQ